MKYTPKTRKQREAFGAGYQEALRDVRAKWDDAGAEAAMDYIADNTVAPPIDAEDQAAHDRAIGHFFPRDQRQCPECGVFTSNANHVCVTYDGPPCGKCGAPTTWVTIAAPGTGSGWACKNNHYEGTCRELEPWEVV